ncbi:MAG: hypothetical protein AAGE59_22930 [Cyanobacteria bacterium P01_F01_bin.86]
MSNNADSSIQSIIQGFLLLIFLHFIAGMIIFALGFIAGTIWQNYIFLGIWVFGALGLFLWQLLYVLPLILWLKRRGKIGMVKGVLIGAVFTALVNGTCYLSFFR